MALRDTASERVEEQREERAENSETTETLDNIDVDMSSIAFTHFHPTTIVTGTFPEDEGNPVIRFPDQQHNDNRRDQGYLGLVVDDPGVIVDADEGTEETVILDVDSSNEIRVFNGDDDNTTVGRGSGLEAEDLVKYDDRSYEGEIVDSFPDDRIILTVGGSASKSVAKALDVNGAETAGMDGDTGDVNGGLIEYAPDDVDADVRSRYARNPELRDDLYGTETAVMVAWRSDIDDAVTGYTGQDDDSTNPVLGLGDDDSTHSDPRQASFAELVEAGERREMKWFSVFSDHGDGLDPVDPTTGDPIGYTYLEWTFDPSVGPDRLPDKDYEFVQQYVEAVNDGQIAADEDTIRENISENQDELTDDPREDRIVELIQSQAE